MHVRSIPRTGQPRGLGKTYLLWTRLMSVSQKRGESQQMGNKLAESQKTRRRWAELCWPLRWSLPRVPPQSGLLRQGYLLRHHRSPPDCLMQHRIRSDGRWPVTSSKAYSSPWVSAFVVASASECFLSTAGQLLVISQPCSSIFTLPPDGPPHRFLMPSSPATFKRL